MVADQDQKEALVELIKPQLANMRKVSHHGRHLVASKFLTVVILYTECSQHFFSRTFNSEM
jgi:hypothetical protein